MSRWRIPSPWPQWRSHWHAWHAWPAGAQALVCVSLSVLACAWGSSQWSGDMWLAWWEYPQAHEALAADIQTLRRQLEQHQERVHALSTMPHPSGLAMPAWQAWPELSTANTATGLPLSYLPGLQPSNGPDHLKWRGNLAQLLAAWQQLPQAYPTQRIKAFELQTLPETDPDAGKPTQPQLQLEISWGQPPPQSANGIRPTEASSAMTHDPTALASGPPAQVWHNPFAVQGLRQSLPPQVQQALHKDSPWDGRALNDFAWAGMLSSAARQSALLRHQGRVESVVLGQAIGQHWGRVVAINPDHLLVQEWHPHSQGQWQSQLVRLPAEVMP